MGISKQFNEQGKSINMHGIMNNTDMQINYF